MTASTRFQASVVVLSQGAVGVDAGIANDGIDPPAVPPRLRDQAFDTAFLADVADHAQSACGSHSRADTSVDVGADHHPPQLPEASRDGRPDASGRLR